jgi:hypothetical protein
MRFLQPPRSAGLPLHPRAKDWIAGERRRHQLQRHDPLPHRVFGLIDVAHAAATNQPPQPIRPELRTLPRIRGCVTHRRLLTRHRAPQTDWKRLRAPGDYLRRTRVRGGVPGIRLMVWVTAGHGENRECQLIRQQGTRALMGAGLAAFVATGFAFA